MSKIFVFGSNLAGIHGAGAARHAREHFGAIYGRGMGLQGHSYGIPTKDHRIQSLPLDSIQVHVENFLRFAQEHPEMVFQVTRIGCGLAGYKDQQIAPLFKEALKPSVDNIMLPVGWTRLILTGHAEHITDDWEFPFQVIASKQLES